MEDALKMFSPEALAALAESSRKFLATDPADEAFLAAAQKALDDAMKAAEQSEHLARYRDIARRMPSNPDLSIEAPNFPYSIHRA
jgi:hypothetical protein